VKTSLRLFGTFATFVLLLCVSGSALADCKSVKGRIISDVVLQYSDGSPCLSPLCTEGRLTGPLKGQLRYFATAAAPYNDLLTPTVSVPQNVAASTGIITLSTHQLCSGNLVFADTSAFSYDSDPSVSGEFEGIVSAVETIIAATGTCAGATGRLRLQGVFDSGCVDCRYVGEVCLPDRGMESNNGASDSDD
jgi:hypothetical protein